jgi:hypothetical protein
MFPHYLPLDCTSKIQHIDSGLGFLMKRNMLKEAEVDMMQGDFAERLSSGNVIKLCVGVPELFWFACLQIPVSAEKLWPQCVNMYILPIVLGVCKLYT